MIRRSLFGLVVGGDGVGGVQDFIENPVRDGVLDVVYALRVLAAVVGVLDGFGFQGFQQAWVFMQRTGLGQVGETGLVQLL